MGRDLHSVAQQLGELGLVELQAQWRMQFGRPAPVNLSRRLLFRLFIYRLQAEKYGDLLPATSRLLSSLDFSHDIGIADLSKSGPAGLKPGTVLVREHGGMNHHVMVTKDGFSWNGANFRSLSQVALAITGTRWNGPRFFGLREIGQ
jgi:hypothetical protein